MDTLTAVVELDQITRKIRLATVHGDDAKATWLYAEYLGRLEVVANALGLDWLEVLDAIETDARSDAFTA